MFDMEVNMQKRLLKRTMALIMVAMMVMISMPVSYASIVEAFSNSVAVSSIGNIGQVVMANEDPDPMLPSANLNSINVFTHGAEVTIWINGEFYLNGTKNQYVIKQQDANQDDEITVRFVIPGTNIGWPGGINALIKQNHGNDVNVALGYELTFGFNSMETYGGIEGEIKQIDAGTGEPILANSTLDADPDEIYEFETTDVTVELFDQYTNPFMGQTVTIYDDGNLVGTASETSNGVYVLEDISLDLGVNTMSAMVDGVSIAPTDDVLVKAIMITDPQGAEITSGGLTLYYGDAVTPADGQADLGVLPNDPSAVWSFVDPVDPIITLDPVTGEVEQMGIEGSEMVMVTIGTATDTALINVVPNNMPSILLNGAAYVEVFLDGTYTELGAAASDPEDGPLVASISNGVDTSVLGETVITYSASDSDGNGPVTVTRTVKVVKKPVESVEITDDQGEIITEGVILYIGDMAPLDSDIADLDAEVLPEDASFQDEVWSSDDETIVTVDENTGDVTGHMVGTANITVEVDGMTDTVEVQVISNNRPVIDLLGVTTINVPLNGTFNDAAIDAWDEEDVDLDENDVVVTGTVNTAVAGNYVLEYDVTDSDNNDAFTQQRIVSVYSDKIVSVEILDPIYVIKGQVPAGIPVQVMAYPEFGEPFLAYVDFGSIGPFDEDGTLYGELYDLPVGIANPDNVQAVQDIIVQEVIIVDPPEAGIEASNVILEIGYGRTVEDGQEVLNFEVYGVEGDPIVTWEVVDADPDVYLTTDGDITIVHGVNGGEAYVKVTVDYYPDGPVLTDTVLVTVYEYQAPPTPTPRPTPRPTVIGVTLDTDAVTLDYGEGADPDFLFYDFLETVTGTSDKRVTWSLDDDTYATVDENGVVTARDDIEPGTGDIIVTVTVTTVIGGATDTAEILFIEQTPLGAIEFYDPYVYGYPGNLFGPELPVTRAEVATMFAKILKMNLDYPGRQVFDDVNADIWYFPYVQAIYRTGIFVGDGNGQFRPDDPISRAEVATVFSKLWQYIDFEVDSTPVTLSDVSSQHWASSYIYQMYNADLVSGFDDGTFRPDEFTQRDHFVVMVNNLIDRPEYDAPFTKYTDIDSSYWAFGDIEAATQIFAKENQLFEE